MHKNQVRTIKAKADNHAQVKHITHKTQVKTLRKQEVKVNTKTTEKHQFKNNEVGQRWIREELKVLKKGRKQTSDCDETVVDGNWRRSSVTAEKNSLLACLMSNNIQLWAVWTT